MNIFLGIAFLVYCVLFLIIHYTAPGHITRKLFLILATIVSLGGSFQSETDSSSRISFFINMFLAIYLVPKAGLYFYDEGKKIRNLRQ